MSDPVTAPVEPEEEAPPQLIEAVEEPTQEQLNATLSDANVQYGLKNYNAAADLYGAAADMQAVLNGEMNPTNADLLYLYGRCLYRVAVQNSDVLGAKVAGEKKKDTGKPKTSANGEGSSGTAVPSKETRLAEEVVEAAVESKDGASKETDATTGSKPYFQFTDDFQDSSDEDEDAQDGEEGGGEEEDDFANAFEVLDVARVLLEKQLQAIDANDQLAKGKAAEPGKAPDEQTRKVKELLADTHDLQAEISLENERFHEAIPDFRASLDLKRALFPGDHNLIAEAHYKLSLALEFASVTAIREAQAQESSGAEAAAQTSKDAPQIDEQLRGEAVVEMEAAIASCERRIQKEQAEVETLSGEARAAKEKQILEVKEIAEEMSQRLVDLRNPAASSALEGFGGGADAANPLSGVLGQMLGESVGEQKKRVEAMTKNANDLTGLVRKKKPQPKAEDGTPSAEGVAVNGKGKGKRSLGDADEEGDGKRAKTEEIA